MQGVVFIGVGFLTVGLSFVSLVMICAIFMQADDDEELARELPKLRKWRRALIYSWLMTLMLLLVVHSQVGGRLAFAFIAWTVFLLCWVLQQSRIMRTLQRQPKKI
jgi:hypothetical protein